MLDERLVGSMPRFFLFGVVFSLSLSRSVDILSRENANDDTANHYCTAKAGEVYISIDSCFALVYLPMLVAKLFYYYVLSFEVECVDLC